MKLAAFARRVFEAAVDAQLTVVAADRLPGAENPTKTKPVQRDRRTRKER